MSKQLSMKIPVEKVKDLTDMFQNESIIDIEQVKSKYEVFRGKIDGNLIIVYFSGKIVYHKHHIIEAILAPYTSIEATKPVKLHKKRTTSNSRNLKVKLNEMQCRSVIEILSADKMVIEKDSTNKSVKKVFRKDGKQYCSH